MRVPAKPAPEEGVTIHQEDLRLDELIARTENPEPGHPRAH
jgi:hypothetical protein